MAMNRYEDSFNKCCASLYYGEGNGIETTGQVWVIIGDDYRGWTRAHARSLVPFTLLIESLLGYRGDLSG